MEEKKKKRYSDREKKYCMNFQGYLGLLLIASPGGKEESAQQSSTGASAIGSVINHDRDTPAAPPSHSLFTLTHTSPSSPPFLALYLNERGEGSLKAVRRRTQDAALLPAFGVAGAGAEGECRGSFPYSLSRRFLFPFLHCGALIKAGGAATGPLNGPGAPLKRTDISVALKRTRFLSS